VVEALGTDLIVNFGAGVHGHKWGSEAGALAYSKAAEAIAKKITLEKYAQTHKELDQALKQWNEVKY